MNRKESADSSTQYFEVQLSGVKEMQNDWKENAANLVPGLLLSEPLYPMSTEASHRNFYYIQVQSDKSPWEIAADLEGFPQIDTCTPDLEMSTDIRPGHYDRWSGNESLESLDDGTDDLFEFAKKKEDLKKVVKAILYKNGREFIANEFVSERSNEKKLEPAK